VKTKSYVLSTPMRNERALLPELLESVSALTPRPALWLIVDDGSRDGTLQWLRDHTRELEWVRVEPAPEEADEYLGGHIARIKSWGLDKALVEAEAAGHPVGYCGILDADVVLPPDHYARLLEHFSRDPGLGVVSSVLKIPGEPRPEAWQRSDRPRGPTQLFSRECLEAIGGLPRFQGYDAVANLKAKNRGFGTLLATDVVATHRRETSTREGHARGYERRGRYAYFLHLNPLLVLARTLAYSTDAPHTKGLHFMRGWLGSAVGRAPRCPDPEVRRHYGRERVFEVARAVLGRGIHFVR
jgi:GT2 family glycosyltransferase